MKETLAASAEEKARLVHLDLLKSLALYFMLLFHCTMYPVSLGLNATPAKFAIMLGRTILSTCVPLFFFVNGILLFRQKLDLKKHTRRILRTVLVTSFWILFLLLVLQPIRGEYYTWEEIVVNRFWSLQMDWNNHLWYMGVLVCIYVFYPVLKQSYDTNRTVFYYFTGICFVLSFGNTLINQFLTVFNRVVRNETIVHDGFKYFHMFNPFSEYLGMGLVYFCVGGIMAGLQEKIEAIPRTRRNFLAAAGILVSCVLLLCLSYGYSILKKQTWDVVWNGYDTVFTLCNVLCLFVLSLNLKRDIPLLRCISDNTLGIYLMHNIFQYLIAEWLDSIPGMRSVGGTFLFATVLLAVCLTVCLIVKKIPVLRKLI